MAERTNKDVNLKVAEAVQDDVNKGIVRVDSGYMQQIGVRPGDIIGIKGERDTVAIVDRAYPGDIGLNIIRMDGIVRRNAKTGIGEIVKVEKIEVKEAKRVVIAPAKKGVIIRASSSTFKQGLLGRAVIKGDIVSLGGTNQRRTTMERSPFFEDVFKSILEDGISGFGFGDIKFVVADTNQKGAVIISEVTEIVLNPEAVEIEEEKIPEVTYEDIGGLHVEIKKIREMVELPLKHPEIFERLGIEPPKGVLLHGPPGTGKTLMAKAVANETNSHFIVINGPEIMSKYYGQSEENLRKIFKEAEEKAPSIIFIDEIDAIAPKREEVKGEVERRVVAQLLSIMDGLKSRGKVVVIAATNVPNILDPALRRPGRFDRELEIGVPSQEGREKVLKIHTRNMPIRPNYNLMLAKSKLKQKIKKDEEEIKKLESELKLDNSSNVLAKLNNEKEGLKVFKDTLENVSNLKQKEFSNLMIKESNDILSQQQRSKIYDLLKEELINEIANITYGFVGADLESLCKEAAMVVLRKVLPDLKLNEDKVISEEILKKLKVTNDDFREALKFVRPSALREVLIEVPNVKWEDIGGMEEIKQELKEAVEWPLNHPDAFKRLGVRPPRGILMYGAPGTGKTMMAKAVANESKANFILVKGPELLSKWVGESEKAVREIFKKARQTSPTIIFFDEIDSLVPRRDMSSDNQVTERVVNQMLTEMDGLEELQDVVVIAATNRPDLLDTALLRPGRFDRIILTPVPDMKTREKIFEVHTKGMPLESVTFKKLSESTEGYVGADIEAIAREAAILALRKDINATKVNLKNFTDAIKKVAPSVTKDIEKTYEELKNHFRSARGKELMEDKPAYLG